MRGIVSAWADGATFFLGLAVGLSLVVAGWFVVLLGFLGVFLFPFVILGLAILGLVDSLWSGKRR